ncbi:MAG: hypothetical protein JJE19_02850 [Methanosarcinales archaeon]|nr:hypothetical protein [Methanosarcinales archaeon]
MTYPRISQEATYDKYPTQYVTHREYPTPDPLSGSSTEQIEINEVLDRLFFFLNRQKQRRDISPQNLISLLEVDLSTLWPRFGIKSETSLIAEVLEKAVPALEPTMELALVSETSLKKDWLKPEEDEAWKDL